MYTIDQSGRISRIALVAMPADWAHKAPIGWMAVLQSLATLSDTTEPECAFLLRIRGTAVQHLVAEGWRFSRTLSQCLPITGRSFCGAADAFCSMIGREAGVENADKFRSIKSEWALPPVGSSSRWGRWQAIASADAVDDRG
jgi:hypothetical protein